MFASIAVVVVVVVVDAAVVVAVIGNQNAYNRSSATARCVGNYFGARPEQQADCLGIVICSCYCITTQPSKRIIIIVVTLKNPKRTKTTIFSCVLYNCYLDLRYQRRHACYTTRLLIEIRHGIQPQGVKKPYTKFP